MRFSVLAIATVPDTDAALRLYDLDGLAPAAIAKILRHRRRQQTGNDGRLRWDACAIAGACLIHHSLEYVEIETLHPGVHDECGIIERIYKSVIRDGRLVTWDGERHDLRLLHLRSLMQDISAPDYWQARAQQQLVHTDLSKWFDLDPADGPDLDEMARRLGYPGMLGHFAECVWPAFLEQNNEQIQTFVELAAMNAYLIALRVLGISQEMSHNDAARAALKLRERLINDKAMVHRQAFLHAWDNN